MINRIQLWCVASVPVAISFIFTLIYIMPKPIGGISAIMPLLHLAPIFIWGVMHARDMPFIAVAAIGLLVDVATALPLGTSAISYFLFLVLVRSQRKYIYREGFAAMWGYFAMLLLVMQLASWALYSFYQANAAALGNAALQWLLTVMLYPLIHYLCFPLVEKLSAARYRLLHA